MIKQKKQNKLKKTEQNKLKQQNTTQHNINTK